MILPNTQKSTVQKWLISLIFVVSQTSFFGKSGQYLSTELSCLIQHATLSNSYLRNFKLIYLILRNGRNPKFQLIYIKTVWIMSNSCLTAIMNLSIILLSIDTNLLHEYFYQNCPVYWKTSLSSSTLKQTNVLGCYNLARNNLKLSRIVSILYNVVFVLGNMCTVT
jgi:hypothetical protein